jgi:hypothetical protein
MISSLGLVDNARKVRRCYCTLHTHYDELPCNEPRHGTNDFAKFLLSPAIEKRNLDSDLSLLPIIVSRDNLTRHYVMLGVLLSTIYLLTKGYTESTLLADFLDKIRSLS